MRRLAVSLLVVSAAALVPAAGLAAPGDRTVVAGHGRVSSSVVTVSANAAGSSVRGMTVIDNGPGFLFISDVRCVRVVGDTVLVGGVIVDSTNPITIGHTSLVAIQDGGPAGDDRVGLVFSFSGLDTCPTEVLGIVPMRPLSHGNLVVTGE